MAHYNYERLSALDSSFLAFESYNTPMHVACASLFEAGPLRGADGAIDFDRIVDQLSSRLHKIPRYRERLTYIPLEGHPVWTDDDRFNLHYHLRHTSLPKPGTERQLKRLCARIMSQQLDRGKPLWETWVVEGIEGDRVAMINKTHHCMVDGISGVDLLTVLLDPTPESEIEEPPRWVPRPAPTPGELLRDEVLERLRAPVAVVDHLRKSPRGFASDVWSGLRAVGESVSAAMRLSSSSPFNQPIGPHRRFDWAEMPLQAISDIRAKCGGTMNDVVLATVAGAVRRFFLRRGVNARELRELEFRVFVPVSMRGSDERGALGNRVASWFLDLPIGEGDPVARLEIITDTTGRLKHSGQARGMEILTGLVEWTGLGLTEVIVRAASQANAFNLVVTNVPGPAKPLYLLGARLLAVYPMVPLFVGQGLGVALFSNAGKVYWGFNADWDVLPDLHDFVGDVFASFEELRGAEKPAPATQGSGQRRRRSATRTASRG